MTGDESKPDVANEPTRPTGSTQVTLDRLRQSNVAELVSSVLRTQILEGVLTDGDLLPKQEHLAEQFGTSSPSVREGLRILEGEGLVTVRRGRHGGAVVHTPKGDSAAYMLGLVFQARGVQLGEIGSVLNELEPICAGLCAQRPDRMETVVARLREVQNSAKAGSSLPELTRLGRRFHEELVKGCGRESMVVLIGVLTSIWSAHSAQSAETGVLSAGVERDYTQSRRRDHEELITLIADGDSDGAIQCARAHLESSTYYQAGGPEAEQVIKADLLARYISQASL